MITDNGINSSAAGVKYVNKIRRPIHVRLLRLLQLPRVNKLENYNFSMLQSDHLAKISSYWSISKQVLVILSQERQKQSTTAFSQMYPAEMLATFLAINTTACYFFERKFSQAYDNKNDIIFLANFPVSQLCHSKVSA